MVRADWEWAEGGQRHVAEDNRDIDPHHHYVYQTRVYMGSDLYGSWLFIYYHAMLPFLVQKRLCEQIHLCITVYSEIFRNLDQHNFRRRSRSSLIFHVEWGAEGKHTQIYQMLQGNQHPVHSNEKKTLMLEPPRKKAQFHQKSFKGRLIFFY